VFPHRGACNCELAGGQCELRGNVHLLFRTASLPAQEELYL
jgi:hypothetical protein